MFTKGYLKQIRTSMMELFDYDRAFSLRLDRILKMYLIQSNCF